MRAVLARRCRSSTSVRESATTRATAANGTSYAVSRIGSARRSEALTMAGEIGGAPTSSPIAIALIPASASRLRYRACSSGSVGIPRPFVISMSNGSSQCHGSGISQVWAQLITCSPPARPEWKRVRRCGVSTSCLTVIATEPFIPLYESLVQIQQSEALRWAAAGAENHTMRVVVLGGAGEVGAEVTRDLATVDDIDSLVIADVDERRAAEIADELGRP